MSQSPSEEGLEYVKGCIDGVAEWYIDCTPSGSLPSRLKWWWTFYRLLSSRRRTILAEDAAGETRH